MGSLMAASGKHALAIAIAAHHAVRDREVSPAVVLDDIRRRVDDPELTGTLERVERALIRQLEPTGLADELGLERVPVLRIDEDEAAVQELWRRRVAEARRVAAERSERGGRIRRWTNKR